MLALKVIRKLSVALATVGLVVPNAGLVVGSEAQAAAAQSESAAAKIVDVSLNDGGILQGQVVSGNGLVQASAPVNIYQGKARIAVTTTNRNGEFSIQGLRGGMYVVATDGAAGMVRAWAPRTAPPSAVKGVLLVPGDQVVRAQLGGFVEQYGLAALIVGGLLAAVIVVAIDHNDDAS